jgi:hypothetical protein
MHQAAERDQSKILVSLDGDVSSFSPALDGEKGLVLPSDAFSENQLLMLTKCFKSLPWTFRESEHLHTNPLHCNDEDVEVLKLICEHKRSRNRVNHLEQFLYLRQHGIRVSEQLTQESLLAVGWTPFMVGISHIGPIHSFAIDFNYIVCKSSVSPNILENIYWLAKNRLNVRINYFSALKVFATLSDSEQEKIMHSYTSDQVRAITDCDWYIHHALLSSLHFDRVKRNLPIVNYPFILKFASKWRVSDVSIPARAMTLEESEDFQAILNRTKYIFFLDDWYMFADELFGLFVYFYLILGSTDFEELLQYLQNCQYNSEKEKSIVKTLYDSPQLQELIAPTSNQEAELPLSLRLVLYDLDWDSVE